MAATRGSPVMADVAREAGVSTMTVSRVLSGHPNVTAATAERVRSAVDALGYRANLAARTLAGGRSRVLGAISVQPETWGPSRTVFGIELAAQAAGHIVSFRTIRDPSVDAMRSTLQDLVAMHAEGVIVVARVGAAIDALSEIDAGIPILITYPTTSLPLAVGIDQEVGARLATRHLAELGHRRIAHVRGPHGWIDADERAVGWRKELKARSCTGRTIVGDWTPASGYAAGCELASDPSVTAAFVANDQMALGVLLALHEAGRSVPGDISIVGFDDVAEAGYFIPPLTTVRQDFTELGRMSVERMLGVVEGGEADQVAITPSLVERASTAPPKR